MSAKTIVTLTETEFRRMINRIKTNCQRIGTWETVGIKFVERVKQAAKETNTVIPDSSVDQQFEDISAHSDVG